MDIDLVNGTVLVSTGLFIFIVGMAGFGLLIAGSMLAVAIASYAQRRDNIIEIKRYTALLEEIAISNKLWYQENKPQMGGDFHILPFVSMTDKQKDAAVKAVTEVTREFLEDRD